MRTLPSQYRNGGEHEAKQTSSLPPLAPWRIVQIKNQLHY